MFKFIGGLAAKIDIKPIRSQALLVVFGLGSIICFLAAFLFIWYNKNPALPLLIGFLFSVGAFAGWLISRRDIDFADNVPTIVSDYKGNFVQTDSRTLASAETLKNFEQLVSGVCHRRPLPEAEGLVDGEGEPIPNSAREAKRRIDEANSHAQVVTNTLIDKLSDTTSSSGAVQPVLNEPESEALKRTNKPQESDAGAS